MVKLFKWNGKIIRYNIMFIVTLSLCKSIIVKILQSKINAHAFNDMAEALETKLVLGKVCVF